MSEQSPGPAGPPPPPEPRWSRRPLSRVALAVFASVAAVTAILVVADAVGGEDWRTEPVGSPPPDPNPPPPEIDYAVTPAQAWQVSAADLMSGDPLAFVALAAPEPQNDPIIAQTVVVTTGTGSAAAVIGLDRWTGDVTWRTEVAGATSVDCHVLGTGHVTVCVASDDDDAEIYDVVTFSTSTGEAEGQDSITFKPRTVTEIDGDIVLAGSSLITGALHMTRGTPTDLDGLWHASSGDGYVPATEYYGGFVMSEGTAWCYVSGATMAVNLSSGDAQSVPAVSGQTSAPWPRSTVLTSTTQEDETTTTVTGTTPGATPFAVEGRPWARLGSSDVMKSFVGIGDTAYDPRTGVELWSADSDPAAPWTSYTAVDDLVLQQTWWEESVAMLAVDAQTGAQRWTNETRSPVLLSRVDDVLLADTSFGIEALRLSTGEDLWAVDYTDLMAEGSSTYAVAHSIAGRSLVTTFDRLVTGYIFH